MRFFNRAWLTEASALNGQEAGLGHQRPETARPAVANLRQKPTPDRPDPHPRNPLAWQLQARSQVAERECVLDSAHWLDSMVVIVAPRGRKVAAPDTPQAAAPPGDADLPLFFPIEGPQTGTNTAPVPISHAVDTRYGFKALKFGLSIDEARRRLKPDRITTNQYNQLVTFWYGPGARNTLGDFPLDYVNALFFRERLFKIEVAFSSNQAQILEAMRRLFGPSFPNGSLTEVPHRSAPSAVRREGVLCDCR